MKAHEPPDGPDVVQSLVRGLAVVRAFDAEHPTRNLSEISNVTGMPRTAVRRCLLTLLHLGYVALHDGRFSLRPSVLELGYTHLSTMSLREVADPHLEGLSSEVHESSSMCVLDGDDVVYVARVPTTRIMAVSITIGTRFPAYVTSMGRVLLANLPERALRHYLRNVEPRPYTARTITDSGALNAELEQVRRQGWSIVDQELEEGLRALAAPVRSRSGRVVAAVNVSSHANLADVSAVRRELLPPLMATVARIEADLDAYPGPERRLRLTS